MARFIRILGAMASKSDTVGTAWPEGWEPLTA